MRRFRREILICLGLVAMTLVAFWPVRYCDFVNYDDLDYVTENPHVHGGLTWANARWALTATHASNWHPLTWWSLQLDQSLWGPSAQGFHLTNLALHIANALLLFGVLRAATGAVWRCALVAALFAVHPLHVESVAWVAERKDVLSTLFWMLTLAAYTFYTAKPGVLRYLLVLLGFVLGLTAKPMLVTLPFVLLLLDYWPLGRLQIGKTPPPVFKSAICNLRSAILEKLPLFLLTAASCAVTVYAQQRAVQPFTKLPWIVRIENAVAAYAGYIGMMFWPRDLSLLYPHPGADLPLWRVAVGAIVLALISFLALVCARRQPYLVVGWLWYVGTLVPVIGLVQVGEQAMADRYTYVPLIGLFLMLAWGLPALLASWRLSPGILAFPAVLLLLACAILSHLQSLHWRDSTALWERALKMNPNNATAHNNLGAVFMDRGDYEEAEKHFQTALRIREGEHDKASHNLGLIRFRQGRLDEAVRYFQDAVRVRPEFAGAHSNLGLVLLAHGDRNGALESIQRANQLQPASPRFHFHLAYVLSARGQSAEAEAEYREGLRLDPNWAEAIRRAAWIMATQRQPLSRASEAVMLAEEACQATGGGLPVYLDTLAAAYAEAGRFDEAVRTAIQARARASDDPDLAGQIEARLRLYSRSEPFRDGKGP